MINALVSSSWFSEFLFKDLFNVCQSCLNESLSVYYQKRTFAAAVHAARPSEDYLVIKMVLPQVITYDLHYLPVAP